MLPQHLNEKISSINHLNARLIPSLLPSLPLPLTNFQLPPLPVHQPFQIAPGSIRADPAQLAKLRRKSPSIYGHRLAISRFPLAPPPVKKVVPRHLRVVEAQIPRQKGSSLPHNQFIPLRLLLASQLLEQHP